MLNWDEPLSPQAPRAPEPAMEAPVINAEPTVKPLVREIPLDDTGAGETSQTASAPLTAKPINPEDKRVVNGLADINQSGSVQLNLHVVAVITILMIDG